MNTIRVDKQVNQKKMPNINAPTSIFATVVSALITLWSAVGQALELRFMIPYPYNWIVFAIFAAITLFSLFISIYILLKRNRPMVTPNPEVEAEPELPLEMSIETNSNLYRYLKEIQKRTHFNDVIVEAGKFSVSLKKSDGQKDFDKPDVMQEIKWKFIGRNVGEKPLSTLSMIITTSTLTAWNERLLLISATLKKRYRVESTVEFSDNDIIRKKLLVQIILDWLSSISRTGLNIRAVKNLSLRFV